MVARKGSSKFMTVSPRARLTTCTHTGSTRRCSRPAPSSSTGSGSSLPPPPLPAVPVDRQTVTRQSYSFIVTNKAIALRCPAGRVF
eukprot:SAG22_NODE_977_length_6195_cov_6.522060_3_plen_86_part_00